MVVAFFPTLSIFMMWWKIRIEIYWALYFDFLTKWLVIVCIRV